MAKKKTELEQLVGEDLDHNPDPLADLRTLTSKLLAANEAMYAHLVRTTPTGTNLETARELLDEAQALIEPEVAT